MSIIAAVGSTSSVDQEVPHLLETVLKETGHGETVSVGTAVPGTDSQNYLMLSGIVADSIPIFNFCSIADIYSVVGYWYLQSYKVQYHINRDLIGDFAVFMYKVWDVWLW